MARSDRGDSPANRWHLSDDEEMEDLGYGGGSSYDDDEEEDDGWGSTKRDDSLWEDPDEAALDEDHPQVR